MSITLTQELATALNKEATERGLTAERLALDALRERFLPKPPFEPRDEWERRLLSIGTDCGVSLTDEQVSREGIYE